MAIKEEDIRDLLGSLFDDLIESIYKRIISELDDQPYQIECADCGEKLSFDTTRDTDNDLMITVARCGCEDS